MVETAKIFKKEEEFITYVNLDDSHQAFEQFLQQFSIEDIPLKVRRHQTDNPVDFGEILQFKKEACNEDYFLESESQQCDLEIQSVKSIIEECKDDFDLTDWNFYVYNPINVCIAKSSEIPNYLETTVSVLIPFSQRNVFALKQKMVEGGYTVFLEKSYTEEATNIQWLMILFDPKKQRTITRQIVDHTNFLIHYSPVLNEKSIMINGILSKNAGRLYTYNENRTYVFTCNGSKDKKRIAELLKNTCSSNVKSNGIYNVYTIKTSKLPNDIIFYPDTYGNADICIFTTFSIPYKAIIDVEQISQE